MATSSLTSSASTSCESFEEIVTQLPLLVLRGSNGEYVRASKSRVAGYSLDASHRYSHSNWKRTSHLVRLEFVNRVRASIGGDHRARSQQGGRSSAARARSSSTIAEQPAMSTEATAEPTEATEPTAAEPLSESAAGQSGGRRSGARQRNSVVLGGASLSAALRGEGESTSTSSASSSSSSSSSSTATGEESARSGRAGRAGTGSLAPSVGASGRGLGSGRTTGLSSGLTTGLSSGLTTGLSSGLGSRYGAGGGFGSRPPRTPPSFAAPPPPAAGSPSASSPTSSSAGDEESTAGGRGGRGQRGQRAQSMMVSREDREAAGITDSSSTSSASASASSSSSAGSSWTSVRASGSRDSSGGWRSRVIPSKTADSPGKASSSVSAAEDAADDEAGSGKQNQGRRSRRNIFDGRQYGRSKRWSSPVGLNVIGEMLDQQEAAYASQASGDTNAAQPMDDKAFYEKAQQRMLAKWEAERELNEKRRIRAKTLRADPHCVAISIADGRFCTVIKGGAISLMSPGNERDNKGHFRDSELFVLRFQEGTNWIAFEHVETGCFLAVNEESGRIRCIAPQMDECCRFDVFTQLSLLASNSRFVCAHPNAKQIVANRTRALSWEQFLIPIRSDKTVTILTSHLRYWSAEADGSLTASQRKIGPQNIFTIRWGSECGTLTLKSYMKCFVCTQDSTLYANRHDPSPDSVFITRFGNEAPRVVDTSELLQEEPDSTEELEETEWQVKKKIRQQLRQSIFAIASLINSDGDDGSGRAAAGKSASATSSPRETASRTSDAEKQEERAIWQNWRGEELVVALYGIAQITNDEIQNTVLGKLFITNYQLVFAPSPDMLDHEDSFVSGWKVPLGMISKVVRTKEMGGPAGHYCGIQLVRKMSGDILLCTTPLAVESLDSSNVLSKLDQLMSRPQQESFAFVEKTIVPNEFDGWLVYDAKTEYERIGLLSSQSDAFRLSTLNSDYLLCPTYPASFIVPANVSDDQLRAAAAFRSKSRVQACVWRHKTSGAVLARCSQPGTGVTGKHSPEDVQMFTKILALCPKGSRIHLCDARPKVNAVANSLKGAGIERMKHYPNCTLQFLVIDNIHVMRNSYERVRQAIDSQNVGDELESDEAIAGWLDHIRKILRGVNKITGLLKEGEPVVVHCSDGWDRTAQLVSLAQLVLDPFYRTIRGFEILIEKEWLSFGHRFGDRLGHLQAPSKENSPVFLQWMDAVYQLTQQFPNKFQFNEHFLLMIVHHVFSCRFGTFLFNCERERQSHQLQNRSDSLWSLLNRVTFSSTFRFLNSAFADDGEPLTPLTTKEAVTFWRQCHS